MAASAPDSHLPHSGVPLGETGLGLRQSVAGHHVLDPDSPAVAHRLASDGCALAATGCAGRDNVEAQEPWDLGLLNNQSLPPSFERCRGQ